jgi:hypothetical protein
MATHGLTRGTLDRYVVEQTQFLRSGKGRRVIAT